MAPAATMPGQLEGIPVVIRLSELSVSTAHDYNSIKLLKICYWIILPTPFAALLILAQQRVVIIMFTIGILHGVKMRYRSTIVISQASQNPCSNILIFLLASPAVVELADRQKIKKSCERMSLTPFGRAGSDG